MKNKLQKNRYSTTFGVDPKNPHWKRAGVACSAGIEKAEKNRHKETDLKVGFFESGAGYEVRTHNLDLGKVALCQLS